MTLGELMLSAQGRIGRQAYWFAAAILIAAQLTASLLDRIVFGQSDSILTILVSVAGIYPGVIVSVKRWHDRDKSGWWCLIVLIPLVGPIWALVENGFLRGTSGPNSFGPDPLG